MPRCCVYGCNEDTDSGKHGTDVSFHRFPNKQKFPERHNAWKEVINGKEFIPSKVAVVCSRHFKEDDFMKSSVLKRRLLKNCKTIMLLKDNVIPSLHLGADTPEIISRYSVSKRQRIAYETKTTSSKEFQIEEFVMNNESVSVGSQCELGIPRRLTDKETNVVLGSSLRLVAETSNSENIERTRNGKNGKQCVLWLAELKSVTRVQRLVRRTWKVDAPGHKSIHNWDRTLKATGSLLPQTGKHPKVSVSKETVERVKAAFARNPGMTIRMASTQLQVPKSTIHKIMHVSVKQLTQRLLNVSVHNALVFHNSQNSKMDHLNFRVNLVTSLFERYGSTLEIRKQGRASINPPPTRLRERHFIEKIPATGKKEKPQKRCIVCQKKGKRKESIYWCPDCKAGLCLETCFKVFHTVEDL
ncbi:hypothetical protein C0J52_19451 [Blattella germanica]|nr:hypothetical protein C0J52_19451 [Blattella germanica]